MSGGPIPNLPAHPIQQRIELDGINVVLLGVPPDAHLPENIFGLNAAGDILWQVEARTSRAPNGRYASMRDEVGIIVARTDDGYQRKIDPKSGKVLLEEQVG